LPETPDHPINIKMKSKYLSRSSQHKDAVAVLISGGVDSAILCAELKSQFTRVHPIYIRFGLQWEEVEINWLKSFLSVIRWPGLSSLTILDEPVTEIYGRHWSTDGQAIPAADSLDAAVYLPGRNLMLLTKAAVWCHLHGVTTIMLGSLQGNPFSDSTPEFDRAMEQVFNLGLNKGIKIERPYLQLTKSEVLRHGTHFPLELTFSCINPIGNQHCGKCNKCAERRRAFREAGLPDKTIYAHVGKLCTA